MPSIVIHLKTAHRLLSRLDIKDPSSFYLGAIAPDAVNLSGKADKKTRYSAHLRSTDYDEWIENVAGYCRGLPRSEKDADFYKGFAVHLFTDIAWDLNVQPKIFKKLSSLGIPDEELNFKKWDVLKSFDALALCEDVWKNDIKPRLECAETSADCTVDRSELLKWRDHIASESFKVPPDMDLSDIITPDDIKLTADKVMELFDISGIEI